MAFDSVQKSGKRVIEAIGVTKSYDGKPIVADFSIRISRGERIAIIGPNGVGKTTLLKILMNKLEPDVGNVKQGTNIQPAIFLYQL